MINHIQRETANSGKINSFCVLSQSFPGKFTYTHVSGSRIINTLINASGSRIMIYASGSKIKDHRYRVILFTGTPPKSAKYKQARLGWVRLGVSRPIYVNIQGVPKKMSHSDFQLKYVPEVRLYFSHVFRNQNFEPIPSKHTKHTHSEY